MVRLAQSLQVRSYQPEDFAAWDAFVARSVEGTFMQSRQFLRYHPTDRFADHSLILIDDQQNWHAIFPAAVVMRDNDRILHSHPGATYGGLVIPENTVPQQIDAIVVTLVEYARASGFQAIRMRTAERIFRTQNFDELDAAYFRAGFQLEGRELSSALRLTGNSRDDLLARWRPLGRRHLRAAERLGVTARVSDDFEAYWSILSETLASRHDARPTHSLEEIRLLSTLLPSRIKLVGGYLQDRLISGTVLFFFNNVAAHTFYIAQDYAFSEYNSLNLVLLTAAELCREQGLQWLNYGISSHPGTQGRELNYGLYAFKRTCGGEGVTRDMWILPLR